jgi:hypothetical protein
MRTLGIDLRHALRSLLHSPGFSLGAVLTLSLGIGLMGAIFSGVYAVLLRPLELSRPARLYTVWQDMAAAGGNRREETGRARNRSFAALAGFIPSTADASAP